MAKLCRRARIRIETQFYQRRCAPFTPFTKTGGVDTVSSQPGHCGARNRGSIITRPRNHRNRHDFRDTAPIFPAMELGEVIGPHQPHKPPFRPAPDQSPQGVDRIARGPVPFDRADTDRRTPRRSPGGTHPRAQRRHAPIRLERIAGRHQPPRLVQPQCGHGEERDPPVPPMRRVEAAAEQPRARAIAPLVRHPIARPACHRFAQGRVCPLPRTCHL